MCCDKIFENVIFFLTKHGSKKMLDEWKKTENLKSFELLFLKNMETWEPIEGVIRNKNRKKTATLRQHSLKKEQTIETQF